MLQDIRQSTKSGWTYLLVGMLIVVFAVFFGVPGDACGSGTTRKVVATVAGTDIYNDDVNIVFNRAFGGQRRLDDEQLRQNRARALRSLILLHLLAHKAEEHGLRVSDEELASYMKDPLRNAEYRSVYGRDGDFDGPLYKAYVQNQLRANLATYEDFKRTELMALKYMTLVEMQFQALPAEQRELFELRNTKVNLEFAKFDPAALTEFAQVSDEEVAEFATTGKKQIEDYFTANKAEYEEPAQVLIRRIFVAKPDQAEGTEKVKAAFEKWEAVQARILEKKENFADVAGEVSEDYAKAKQGLMEWSALENLDQNIATVVEKMKVGDVDKVETSFAFMLVKLEDKKEAKKTPLSDVSDDIARKLLQEKRVNDTIKAMVSELQAAAKGAESLAAAVDGLKAGEAPADGEEPVEGEEAQPTKWSGVTVDETGDFTMEGQDLAALFGSQFPGMSSRAPWDVVPKVGKSPELARDAFKKLSKDKPLAEAPYEVGGASFLVRLKGRTEPADDEFEKESLKLAAEVRNGKAARILGSYPALFAVPLEDYGPFLESLFDKSLDSGVVRLYERNYDAIPLIQKDREKPVDPTKAPEKTDEPAGDKAG